MDDGNVQDNYFLQGRNGCLNQEQSWSSWYIYSWMKERALIQFFEELGQLLLILHFLFWSVFIQFLASLGTIESTPIKFKFQMNVQQKHLYEFIESVSSLNMWNHTVSEITHRIGQNNRKLDLPFTAVPFDFVHSACWNGT